MSDGWGECLHLRVLREDEHSDHWTCADCRESFWSPPAGASSEKPGYCLTHRGYGCETAQGCRLGFAPTGQSER